MAAGDQRPTPELGPASDGIGAFEGPAREAGVELARLAAANHEIVTGAQLKRLGIGRRRIGRWAANGRLHRLYRGVFTVGSPRLSGEGRWLAAVRACGPDALLSHLSAGALWGLLSTDPALVHVTTPRCRKGHPGIRVHRPRRAVADADRVQRGGIPVTSAARTWFDLAAMLGDRRLKDALSRGEREGILDPAALATALGRRRGVRGQAAARRVLGAHRSAHGIRFRSGLERTFWEAWMARGLAAPEVNARACGLEVDLLWRRAKLAVELDGARWHRTGADRERDELRNRLLTEAGYTVLRFTEAEIATDLEACLTTTASALTNERRVRDVRNQGRRGDSGGAT